MVLINTNYLLPDKRRILCVSPCYKSNYAINWITSIANWPRLSLCNTAVNQMLAVKSKVNKEEQLEVMSRW